MSKSFLAGLTINTCLLLLATAFASCNNGNEKAATIQKDSASAVSIDTSLTNSFSYRTEQLYLKRKTAFCTQLALYDIKNGTADFELRIWDFPSMWDPGIIYILKAKDASWTLFHYQYYALQPYNTDPAGNPLIDSVVMESVRPQKMDWPAYISNLQLDSLWNLQTESAIKGKIFAVVDGSTSLLELSHKGKYKYFYYTSPEIFQDKDIYHKRFMEFKKRLVEPIIYNGMRNP